MSYIPLDAIFKRKKLEEEQERLIRFPDKRRFRSKISIEESLEKSIISEMSSYGIPSNDIPRILREYRKVPQYQNLNVSLFLETYNYYVDRDSDFSIIAENFDSDFEQVVTDIYMKGLFGGKKFSPVEKYKFRQDFIIYMYLIYKSQSDNTEYSTESMENMEDILDDFTDDYFEPVGE